MGGEGKVIPNNTHFDTTRANIENSGAVALDLPVPEGSEPSIESDFKGNMDLTGQQARNILVVTEGFPTYGGL